MHILGANHTGNFGFYNFLKQVIYFESFNVALAVEVKNTMGVNYANKFVFIL